MMIPLRSMALHAGARSRRLFSATATPKFDYIIVGAGSAGCVLANRLSADPNVKVLLVEAGPKHTGPMALSITMPAMVLENIKRGWFNWSYKSEPEPHLNGRTMIHDRGKALGGSSSINGMVWIRGHKQDYDGWEQQGAEGWGYTDVLPYFKKIETYSAGGDAYRGGSGPMRVHRSTPADPLSLAFLKAGEEAGYPMTDDINGYKQEGFGPFDKSTHKGERWSTANGYLEPAMPRPNLQVVTNAMAQRVSMSEKRATGLVYKDKSGQEVHATASKEVILSAGAIGTPHLMLLSGLGPKAHLEETGIEVVADLPGVGANLNDHPDFVMKFRCTQPVTLWPKSKPLASIAAGIQWFLTREGICASNHFDSVATVRSHPDLEYPDLQFTISPIAMDHATWEPLNEHAFQLHVGLMQAHSRGKVDLASSDPSIPPRILVNYYDDERDRQAVRRGIQLMRQLVSQPAFAPYVGDEVFPGREANCDDSLDEAINEYSASQWHLSGTAKMGRKDDPNAVVDPEGLVYGVDGLRVVDASIMPFVPNSNINAPTIMIAEKISDSILGKPFCREDVDVWSVKSEASSMTS